MSTAYKAAVICCVILVCAIVTVVLFMTMHVFCKRKDKKEAECAAELLDNLVNITITEAHNECRIESFGGQLRTYGNIIIYVRMFY